MIIRWGQAGGAIGEESSKVRAAEYVRMSTEHQQYSTDNQRAAIRKYAEERGYEIVRSYADEGKSGLNLEGRPAMQRLFRDIEAGAIDFQALLVYDVSRLGRFQDPDEAASHELRCRHAGVAVHYCAEQFENDGSLGSSIIKTFKRAMAGEYSRELSVKVFAGQANLIRMGFRQGGTAGYGLRRLLVDHQGRAKGVLERGQHKSIATDRIVLIPGPAEEIAVVNEIYRRFTENGWSERKIAEDLNRRGVHSDLGKLWARPTVHQVLINEKYIGNNVWGRTSFKLKERYVKNAPEQWVRADRAFEGIVEPEKFAQAQRLIASRSATLSDEGMLDCLRSILKQRGELTGLIIDEYDGLPSSSAFKSRFGSLLRAYSLVGYHPGRDYRYLEINRRLRALHPTLVEQVIRGLKCAGGSVSRDAASDLMTINEEFTASVVIVRCVKSSSGSLKWKLRLDNALRPDLTVAIRMDVINEKPLDYYILPFLDMRQALLRLAEHNGLTLDAYRFDDLERFYRLAARTPFRRAA